MDYIQPQTYQENAPLLKVCIEMSERTNTYEWINVKTGETVIISEYMPWATYYSGVAHFWTERDGWRYDAITAKRHNERRSTTGAGE